MFNHDVDLIILSMLCYDDFKLFSGTNKLAYQLYQDKTRLIHNKVDSVMNHLDRLKELYIQPYHKQQLFSTIQHCLLKIVIFLPWTVADFFEVINIKLLMDEDVNIHFDLYGCDYHMQGYYNLTLQDCRLLLFRLFFDQLILHF